MSSVSDPLLPVQTSAMHDANIDETDPAQTEAERERRFRWIRLGVLATAGRIVLDSGIVRQMRTLAALPEGLAAFADSMFAQLARFVGIRERNGLATVAQVVLHAAIAAVGIAFAYQVPLWFCVACPAVLGLLAPLVINAGLGALADAACRHWQLPSDECNDLWYGAFAAGMVLSLASAVPIVFICRLPECARRH